MSETMYQQGLDHRLGKMTFFDSRDVSPGGAMVGRLRVTEEGSKILHDCFNQINYNGGHKHSLFYILHKTSEHQWTAGPLCMHCIMCREGADITHAKEIKLSKIRITLSDRVFRDSTFVDCMKQRVKYAEAFDLELSVKFADSYLTDMVEDALSP